MTKSELVTELKERLALYSDEALERLGRAVDRAHRRVTSETGLIVSRRVTISQAKSLGSASVTFSGIEKIERVIDDTSGDNIVLAEVTFDQLRRQTPGATTPTSYAIESMDANSVTIRLDVLAQDTDVLKADGHTTVADLDDADEPAFPESFHEIILEAVMMDELRKKSDLAGAKIARAEYDRILSNLKYWIAKSGYLKQRQGERVTGNALSAGAASSGSGTSGGTSYTQTGLITFDRDPSAPFAVTSGSAVVPNLDAEKVGGSTLATILSTALAAATAALPNVTLAGAGNYLSLAGQVLTRTLIDLAAHVTGRLPFANLTASTAASKLLGRGSASGAGDFEEITLGTGLSMSGTTLNATGVAGSDTQVQFNDGGALAGEAGMTYAKATDVLSLAGAAAIGTNPASAGAVRLANTGTVKARNAANAADVQVLAVNASDQIELAAASGALVSLLSGQLKFPASQNASSDANTIDDYEEGTYSPVIGGGTSESGQTYTLQFGRYIKIGKRVTCYGRVTLSAKGVITGNVVLKNFPFTSDSGGYIGTAHIAYWEGMTTAMAYMTGAVNPSTTQAELFYNTGAASALGSVVTGDLTNASSLIFCVNYQAAA